MSIFRSVLVRAAAFALGAVVVFGLIAMPAGANAATSPHGSARALASSPVTRYAIAVPVCPPPTAGHVQCLAMRKVSVPKGTPGAVPVKIGDGIATAHVARAGANATIGPAGGLTPSDLATAYGFNATGSGASQTVGIIDWGNDPTIAADLNAFDSQYHLSACTTTDGCLRILNQLGQTSPLPTDQGGAGEISLDVESVHSVCRQCKIDLIEVTSNSFSDTGAGVNEAVKLGATEVSNSYGGPDTTGGALAYAADYNHPGVVITASSGDHGYYGFDYWPDTPSGGPAATQQAPEFPAELATVVSVGGTSLYLNQNGTRQSETVWNEDGAKDHDEELAGAPLGASGGGCSLFVTAQAWQRDLTAWPKTDCGTNRLDNDVSAVADPYTGFDTYNTSDGGTGWGTIGGTSLASPVIAAMYALAGGANGVTYPALTLYGHLGTPSLYNVTALGNGFCGGEGAAQCGNVNDLEFDGVALGAMDCDYPTSGSTPSVGDLACDAAPGYNGPSGVGTPNGLGSFAKAGPRASVSGPTSVVHGVAHTWTASTSDPFPHGVVKTYSWNWGDGSAAAVTSSGSASHHYATAGGHHTITLTVTDSYGQKGSATRVVAVT